MNVAFRYRSFSFCLINQKSRWLYESVLRQLTKLQVFENETQVLGLSNFSALKDFGEQLKSCCRELEDDMCAFSSQSGNVMKVSNW